MRRVVGVLLAATLVLLPASRALARAPAAPAAPGAPEPPKTLVEESYGASRDADH